MIPPGDTLAIVDAEVGGLPGCTVRVEDGTVAAVGRDVQVDPGDEVVDASGGALIPGLHDHHVHLYATAAAARSVPCGPPTVTTIEQLAATLRAAEGDRGWIRGVGYHDSVAGRLDRWTLDRLRADVPVRVQHRSGSRWIVNSAGVDALGLAGAAPPGIQRDADGGPTGVIVRADEWLGSRWPRSRVSLDAVSRELASHGVTGVTDATADTDEAGLQSFVTAAASGELRQRLHVMGRPALPTDPRADRVTVGNVKLVLDEDDLPGLVELAEAIRNSHRRGRGVAIHAVTRATLALVVAALREAGLDARDRIEHASVTPPALAEAIADLGVTVVTQPNFLVERGDQYLADVDPDDLPWLYPVGLLVDHGIPVAIGTDSPFGYLDPWAAIAAAVDRRTASGAVLGPEHEVTAADALGMLLTPLQAPGDAPRRVAPGAPADLVLLDAPLDSVLRAPGTAHVRHTLAATPHQVMRIWDSDADSGRHRP